MNVDGIAIPPEVEAEGAEAIEAYVAAEKAKLPPEAPAPEAGLTGEITAEG